MTWFFSLHLDSKSYPRSFQWSPHVLKLVRTCLCCLQPKSRPWYLLISTTTLLLNSFYPQGNVLKSLPALSHVILTKLHTVRTIRPFQRWGNWGSKRWSDFSNVMQQGSSWGRDSTHQIFTCYSILLSLLSFKLGPGSQYWPMEHEWPWHMHYQVKAGKNWWISSINISYSPPPWPWRIAWPQVGWWPPNPRRVVTLERREQCEGLSWEKQRRL